MVWVSFPAQLGVKAERNCWLDQSFFEAVLDLVRGQGHVNLTFDDGNASDVQIVLPALEQRGLKATFFVCSGRLDQPSFLNRSHIRKLQAHGMNIGSHGVAHISWRKLPQNRLADELEGSRRVLQDVCGLPVDTAACPFGAYDRTVSNGLRRSCKVIAVSIPVTVAPRIRTNGFRHGLP